MDIIELHDRALDATTAIVANIDAAHLANPTPCAEFDVRALLGHLIGGNHMFAALTDGEPGTAASLMYDFDGDDALTPYRKSAAAVSAAWQGPGYFNKTVTLPIGDVPGIVAVTMHTVETIVHGWDLATATGQPAELSPELHAIAWEGTKDIGDELRGPGRPFGPALEAPPGASDTVRLMAWLGRAT